MSAYQKEQIETFSLVRQHLDTLSVSEKERLKAMASDYFLFREETASFLSEYFGKICTQNCYESNLSACCSKEGIITFFADLVINCLVSPREKIDAIMQRLQKPNTGFKCIYLGQEGCMWQMKPIVCEMFLCDQAEKEVLNKNPQARMMWEALKKREKEYTWPDRQVLFDTLEEYFMDAGFSSPLMYLHNSPGLLLVKKRAGIGK